MARRTSIARRSVVLCLWLAFCTASGPHLCAKTPDRDAFVYILNMGIRDNKIVYNGLRVAFAVVVQLHDLRALHIPRRLS